jgi:hypothetical protein
LESIAVTKEDLDNDPNHYIVPYKNDSNRTKPEGEDTMDCSELVCRYLQRIGWSSKVKWLNTKALYNFAEAHPKWLKKQEKDYKPKIGDIFLWKKDSGMGHTGVVIEYDESTDAVTTIEAISEGEYKTTRGDNSGHPGYRFKGVIKWRWSKRIGSHLIGNRRTCRFYTPKVHHLTMDK